LAEQTFEHRVGSSVVVGRTVVAEEDQNPAVDAKVTSRDFLFHNAFTMPLMSTSSDFQRRLEL
jgi:hypothetical protein